jgi:phosphohistidine phosphatase SixA
MNKLPTHLYIIRHAWAEEGSLDQDDYDRRLTKKGHTRFENFMQSMKKLASMLTSL